MATKSFSQLKSQLDPDFPLNSLVMFENEGDPHAGFVIGTKKDRYVVLTKNNEELELNKPRLHGVPLAGLIAPEEKTEKIVFLSKIPIISPDEIAELWRKVEPQEKVYHVADLTKTLRGQVSAAEYVALRSALIRDRIYFDRDANGFAPRRPAQVETFIEVEKKREKKRKLFSRTAEFLRLRVKDKTLVAAPELMEALSLLQEAAAGVDLSGDQESTEDLQLLFETIESHQNQEYLGRTNERAFWPLVRAGILSKNTNLSLIRHNPRMEFSTELLEAAGKIATPQKIDDITDRDIRQDFTAQASFTIDDSTTKDMDDALFLEQTEGGYKVYVHITDVAYFIKKDTPLDLEAKARATSIYCPEIKIPMFPEILSNSVCSLMVDQIRPAISIVFDIDHGFYVRGADVMPSIIKIAKRLDYQDVDQLLHHGDPTFEVLHQVVTIHEGQRLEAGATPVIKRDAQPVIHTEDGSEQISITVEDVDEQSPARALVGEMMVLANIVMANFLSSHEIPALYRSQDVPDEDGRDFSKIPAGPARDYVERGRLKRSQVVTYPRYHATLGTQAYIQCTSPIRRYLDLVLQRQISSVFQEIDPPYSEKKLTELLPHLDEPLSKAQLISRESKRFWLQKYLEKAYANGRKIGGTVVRVDTKFPMIELDEIYIIVAAKIRNPKLGQKLDFVIDKLDVLNDFIRFEEARR